jgi:hypothetical protein
MGIQTLLNDTRFNIFFSFVVGLGFICMLRPKCSGSECNVTKAPEDKDFEKHVYRMGGGKCYEFKTEMTDCPASGAIEAFRECPLRAAEQPCGMVSTHDQFARRGSLIQKPCE